LHSHLDERGLARDEERMADLHVTLGPSARGAFCSAFDAAQRSIDVEFLSISDSAMVDGLNRAAARGVAVTVHVEGDPDRYNHAAAHVPRAECVQKTIDAYAKLFDAGVRVVAKADPFVLEHAKAAVIDGARSLFATANANPRGFNCPGEVCVEDDAARDVSVIRDAIAGRAGASERVVAGPNALTFDRVQELLRSPHDARIATEDLSDWRILHELVARRSAGLHDEVLVNRESPRSATAKHALRELTAGGVSVQWLAGTWMHEKYVDVGDRIYVGSANLTWPGLNTSHEVGIVAPAADFGDGAAALRADFDRMWSAAQPVQTERSITM
jgi:phosphatidylserine/phosphatidylglycerophosphate/cardiolipin synthase-like enzyme